jgi:RNA polymerase sigma factor (sigma-70 family)
MDPTARRMEDWRSEIEAMLSGDLRAVDRFFRAWLPRIRRWGSGCGDFWRAEVDDVAQEVMIKLTRNHCRVLVEWHGMADDAANTEASLAGYLRRICVNTARDLNRGRDLARGDGQDVTELLAGPDSDPLAALEGERLAAALAQALARLSVADREILELRFNHGLSLQQLAEQLGVTANAAGQRAHRAEKRLLARLTEIMQGGQPARTHQWTL